jgi:hypothetical protein
LRSRRLAARLIECAVCGNEIPEGSPECQFCNSMQPGGNRTAASREGVRTVNIKTGLPTVEDGLAKLESELRRARQDGVMVMRVIHGYGSGGTGGGLRAACRPALKREIRTGRVKRVLEGENYSKSTNAGREWMRRCPALKSSIRTDAGNPGITFVEL